MLLQDHHLPTDETDDEEECRICLQTNPLLITEVCACRSYVHPECLALWRTQFARDHIKRRRCEVCLSEYTMYLPSDDDSNSSSDDDDDGEEDCVVQCMPCLVTMLCLCGVSAGLYVYSVLAHGLAPSPTFLFALVSTILLPLGHELVESHRQGREFYYGRYVQVVLMLLGGMMMWITLNGDNVVAGLFEYVFAIYFVWFMVIILRGCDRRRRRW